MDDIFTFEADNELDWVTYLEFENIFASVNNLSDNVPTSWLNEGEIQQSKNSKENRLNLTLMSGKEGSPNISLISPFTFFVNRNRTC
jgi:hypothetical protein